MRRFLWSPSKSQANLRKHRVSFELATTVFDDPLAVSEVERIVDHEVRWRTIGVVGGMVLLVVAHTILDEESGDETYRIISARRAQPMEKRRYERG